MEDGKGRDGRGVMEGKGRRRKREREDERGRTGERVRNGMGLQVEETGEVKEKRKNIPHTIHRHYNRDPSHIHRCSP